MNQFSIEISTREDAAAIKQVQHDVWIHTYPNEALGITLEVIRERVSKNLTPESIERLQESMNELNQRTWVLKDDMKIIGYCTAVKNESFNQLVAIYLLPEYHDKGLGKGLIEASLEWMGSNKDILVEVASYNDRAIKFYEKYGFKKNGKTGNSGQIPTIHLVRSKN